MRVDRPAPGEELNEGRETPPRPAASVIVVRDAAGGMEALLVRRNPEASFMGGAWVFPGGAVHHGESPADAGLRELAEEAAIDIPGGADALVPFSRWVTPAEVKIRFDTFFFVVEAPPGAAPRPDGEECVDAAWRRPADALESHRRDELSLVFPTVKHLEQLAGEPTAAATIAAARARTVVPVQPRIVVSEGGARVLLPGEPGYDG